MELSLLPGGEPVACVSFSYDCSTAPMRLSARRPAGGDGSERRQAGLPPSPDPSFASFSLPQTPKPVLDSHLTPSLAAPVTAPLSLRPFSNSQFLPSTTNQDGSFSLVYSRVHWTQAGMEYYVSSLYRLIWFEGADVGLQILPRTYWTLCVRMVQAGELFVHLSPH